MEHVRSHFSTWANCQPITLDTDLLQTTFLYFLNFGKTFCAKKNVVLVSELSRRPFVAGVHVNNFSVVLTLVNNNTYETQTRSFLGISESNAVHPIKDRYHKARTDDREYLLMQLF